MKKNREACSYPLQQNLNIHIFFFCRMGETNGLAILLHRFLGWMENKY